ncbi:MAG: nucleoside hydrolase [Elusimicrobia bacterium]|nr:nucleoside hydrolase [Elusimicrobiota bacterium]
MDVLHDHDAHVDDLLAMLMLLCRQEVRLLASTVCPGDCYPDAGLDSAGRLAEFMGVGGLALAGGTNAGKNPFPEPWREDSRRVVETMPAAPREAAREGRAAAPAVAPEPAFQLLARVLQQASGTRVLATGPLTNLAEAIAVKPSIARSVERVWAMGGAVRVRGNVREAGHDGTAEWNFYNNPAAAAAVFASGVPITLVSLDATNRVPVTADFLQRLRAQSSHRVSRLALSLWDVARRHVENADYHEQYFFWDTLAAAALLDPTMLKTETMRLRVVTEGPSQGRTVEDPNGREVEVGVGVNAKRLEDFILALFRK